MDGEAIEARAWELLATEYERMGFSEAGAAVRRGGPAGWLSQDIALRAIVAALTPKPSAEMLDHLTRIIMHEAEQGADSPCDWGDAERIARAILSSLTPTEKRDVE